MMTTAPTSQIKLFMCVSFQFSHTRSGRGSNFCQRDPRGRALMARYRSARRTMSSKPGKVARQGDLPLWPGTTRPFIHFALRSFIGQPVLLLDLAHQLVPLSCDLIQIVTRQLAPLFEDLALNLLPFAFNLILTSLHFDIRSGQDR
jgi:hypothetical protein